MLTHQHNTYIKTKWRRDWHEACRGHERSKIQYVTCRIHLCYMNVMEIKSNKSCNLKRQLHQLIVIIVSISITFLHMGCLKWFHQYLLVTNVQNNLKNHIFYVRSFWPKFVDLYVKQIYYRVQKYTSSLQICWTDFFST